MPGYKSHLAVGGGLALCALSACVYTRTYEPEPLVAAGLMATACLAALFPDVDTYSKGRGVFYGMLFTLDVALMWLGEWVWAAVLGLAAMLPSLGKHRGWTHTWIAMLLVPAALLSAPYLAFAPPWQSIAPYYAAAVLGYCSHLMLDRCF